MRLLKFMLNWGRLVGQVRIRPGGGYTMTSWAWYYVPGAKLEAPDAKRLEFAEPRGLLVSYTRLEPRVCNKIFKIYHT